MMSQSKNFALLTGSTLLIAVGTYFFKFTNNFTFGGITGLAVLVAKSGLISAGDFNFIVNMLLLLVGFLILGKNFAAKTAYCSILLSVALSLLERICPMNGPLTDQPMLELAFAIALPALGSAVLFNIGSSSGGTDIIAMIIKKYSTMNISTALLLCDLLIVVMAFFVFDTLTGLCSILGLMAKTLVIDKVIERMKLNKFFTIVCDYPEPICDFITEELGHTATTYHAEGAYSHTQRTVILTVVDVNQAILLQRFIKKNEPTAFITVTKSSEIIGKGFSNYI